MQLVAGRITRPHGVRGEVAVEVRTDNPDTRFFPGAELATDPVSAGPLRIETVRWHQAKLLVRFQGRTDRSDAEALGGVMLMVEAAPTDDPDAFYPHELEGLDVVDSAGGPVGTVRRVLQNPGHDTLEVQRPDGRTALVPFVSAIVTAVDIAANRLVVDPPTGLLEDEHEEPARTAEE